MCQLRRPLRIVHEDHAAYGSDGTSAQAFTGAFRGFAVPAPVVGVDNQNATPLFGWVFQGHNRFTAFESITGLILSGSDLVLLLIYHVATYQHTNR